MDREYRSLRCVCVCARACVRACVRVCVCVQACARFCDVFFKGFVLFSVFLVSRLFMKVSATSRNTPGVEKKSRGHKGGM